MRKYVNEDCEQFLEQGKRHYDLCVKFYQLLERHSHPCKVKEEENFMESIEEHFALQKKMDDKKT